MTIKEIKTKWENYENEIMRSRGLEDPVTIMFCRILEEHINHCNDFGKTPYTREWDEFVDTLYKTCINYDLPEI